MPEPHSNAPKEPIVCHPCFSVIFGDVLLLACPGRMFFFSSRSVKQREDILTNKLAANTHVITRKTQIAQCAAVNNWGDTWNIIRWCSSADSRKIVHFVVKA